MAARALTTTMRRVHAAALTVVLLGSVALVAAAPAPAFAATVQTPSSLLAQLADAAEDDSDPSPMNFSMWELVPPSGCATDVAVLRRDTLGGPSNPSVCRTSTGPWRSVYDGLVRDMPTQLRVTQLVQGVEAWQSGAYLWDAAKRTAYNNDLGSNHSLVILSRELHEQRLNRDVVDWQPPLEQCRYAASWIAVKFRWSLSVDPAERTVLEGLLEDGCGEAAYAAAVDRYVPPVVPQPEPEPEPYRWPIYITPHNGTIYEMEYGSYPKRIDAARWRDEYRNAKPEPANTAYVKYAWSPTIYAVTTWWPDAHPLDRTTERLSPQQWRRAGSPTPQLAGLINGSTLHQWRGSNELFITGEDGVVHKLTRAEWAATGHQPFDERWAGYATLPWARQEILFQANPTEAVRITFAQWQAAGAPTPRRLQRIPGDQFYLLRGSPNVYYHGPTMQRRITYAEWRAAGSPKPVQRPY